MRPSHTASNRKPFLFLLLAVLSTTAAAWNPMSHRAPRSSAAYSTWAVYWDGPTSLNAANSSAPSFKDISVFAAEFGPNGKILISDWAIQALRTLKAAAPKTTQIYLTVVNDYRDGTSLRLKDPNLVHTALTTRENRDQHINQLLDLCKNVDGLEIDYEQLWLLDRDVYSEFIEELAQKLHARGQRLAVDVEPKTNDTLKDKAGAIDWARIAKAADEIKVMAYLYHSQSSPPGPIAPTYWVSDLAKFALTKIPVEKLTMVLTLSGCDWPVGGAGKSMDYKKAEDIRARTGAKRLWNEREASPFFHYAERGVAHEVWYEDKQSLEDKIRQLKKLGVQKIGLWRIGTGDPEFWRELTTRQ